MQSDWYILLSMGLRYFFAALLVLIVWRGWIITLRDTRRARILRAWAPDTGAIGELVVTRGCSTLRKGTRIPVPKEGLLGASRRSDIRIKTPDIRRYHAHVEQREDGLLLEPLAKAEIFIAGRSGKKILLRSGDRFSIGQVELMLLLYDTAQPIDSGITDDTLFSPVGLSAGRAARPVKTTQAKLPRQKRKRITSVSALFQPIEDEQWMQKSAPSKQRREDDEVEWWPEEKPSTRKT